MQFLTAKQALARKLDIDYSNIANNQLFTDADLGDYVQQASNRAFGLEDWPFKEDPQTVTTLNTAYYDAPPKFEPRSVMLLVINGKSYKKWNYLDYVLYFQNNPTATDCVFAEYAGFLFVNQNSYTVGQAMDIYGKLLAPTFSNSTDELPFTSTDTQQDIGNEAIILLAHSNALASDKLKQYEAAEDVEKKALTILENIWKPYEDANGLSQRNNRPQFDVPNFFGPTPPNNANNLGRFF